jgi:hypothetical protein
MGAALDEDLAQGRIDRPAPAMAAPMSATMASYQRISSPASAPTGSGWRSARVTTPMGRRHPALQLEAGDIAASAS